MTYRREISIQQLHWWLLLFTFVPGLLLGYRLTKVWSPPATAFELPAQAHAYLTGVVRGTALGFSVALLVAAALAWAVIRLALTRYDIYRDVTEREKAQGWRKWLWATLLLVWLGFLAWLMAEPVLLAHRLLTTTFTTLEQVRAADLHFRDAAGDLFRFVLLFLPVVILRRQAFATRTHFLSKGAPYVA